MTLLRAFSFFSLSLFKTHCDSFIDRRIKFLSVSFQRHTKKIDAHTHTHSKYCLMAFDVVLRYCAQRAIFNCIPSHIRFTITLFSDFISICFSLPRPLSHIYFLRQNNSSRAEAQRNRSIVSSPPIIFALHLPLP